MSDFFAGLSGVRFPDVVMNQGPLPGTGGLPNPLHDSVDGRINYNSTLLGDIQPYAYGEPGYLSSQNAYLNIPHKIQKIVTPLFLPAPDGTENFRLDHAVDDGDVVFTLRLDRNSEICSGLSSKLGARGGLGTAIDPLVNLCTVNYILAGLQICTQLPGMRRKWDALMHHLDKRFSGKDTQAYDFKALQHVVRHLIRPFGVAHGSEKQGGQHEGSLSAATWPVNFVTTLTLDGKDANVVNVWHKHDIEAGSDLVLRLKPMPLPAKYTLNHWAKNLAEKSFSQSTLEQVRQLSGSEVTHVWQLVPDIFSLDLEDPAQLRMNGVPNNFQSRDYCWQQEGYWHIARSQIKSKEYGHSEYYFNDLANNLRGGHMDLTFQPTFYAIPYRDSGHPGGAAVAVGAARNVHNLLGAPKRGWESALRLEQGFGQDGFEGSGYEGSGYEGSGYEGSGQGEASKRRREDTESVTLYRDPLFFGDLRAPFTEAPAHHASHIPSHIPSSHIPAPGISELAPPSGSAGLVEEIGFFEESRPTFSVPKPGLKAAPRRNKGKGVMGAVLASDGSVTQEQSRML